MKYWRLSLYSLLSQLLSIYYESDTAYKSTWKLSQIQLVQGEENTYVQGETHNYLNKDTALNYYRYMALLLSVEESWGTMNPGLQGGRVMLGL